MAGEDREQQIRWRRHTSRVSYTTNYLMIIYKECNCELVPSDHTWPLVAQMLLVDIVVHVPYMYTCTSTMYYCTGYSPSLYVHVHA